MRKTGMALSLVAMVIVVAFGLAACGAGQPAESSSGYADEQFVKDLSKALEARWSVTEASGSSSKGSDDADREMRSKAVDAELAVLEDYTGAKFEDSALQEKAIKYVNCLKDQKASLEYYSVDNSRYKEDWSKAYDARTQLIKDFVNNYSLTVSEKNAGMLNDLLTNAKLVSEKEDQQAAVDAICASIQFQPSDSEYGKEYAAIVENTSSIDFSYFSINVNLLDADGVIVESTGDSVDNWEAGQKVRFTIHTLEDFASIIVKASNWRAAQ